MRATTTIDINRHVLAAAEALAKEEELYGFRPLPPRGVVVTDDFVNELRDELGV